MGIPNPLKKVVRPTYKEKEPDSLDLEQARDFFNAAQDDREKVIAYLGLGQDFRKSEVLRLNVGNIGEDWIRVSGKERTEGIALLPEVRQVCLPLMNGRSANEPV